MDYRKMTPEQLSSLKFEAIKRGNLNAASEIADFQEELYGKRVSVVKGRKVPIGIVGTVFWVKRYDNSKHGDPWGIYSSTRVGIKDDAGNAYFTASGNVSIVNN